jgi:hypothetical protein
MGTHTEAQTYRRQMIEMANDAQRFLTIPANIIQNEKSDAVLGKIVRVMYEERCKSAQAHIEYIQSLETP